MPKLEGSHHQSVNRQPAKGEDGVGHRGPTGRLVNKGPRIMLVQDENGQNESKSFDSLDLGCAPFHHSQA